MQIKKNDLKKILKEETEYFNNYIRPKILLKETIQNLNLSEGEMASAIAKGAFAGILISVLLRAGIDEMTARKIAADFESEISTEEKLPANEVYSSPEKEPWDIRNSIEESVSSMMPELASASKEALMVLSPFISAYGVGRVKEFLQDPSFKEFASNFFKKEN